MDEREDKGPNISRSDGKALADLHQLIPERALMLVEALRVSNEKFKKFSEWREAQIRKFGIMAVETAMELERAYFERRITTVAWTTRNLLELSIWIDYCNISDEHAKRFWDDRLRDLYGMSGAVQGIVEVKAGAKDRTLDEALANLAQFAQSQGIQELEDDFKPVSEAARELGRWPEFRSANKLLSKLAHPTAWAVHIVASPAAEVGYTSMILQDGVAFALNAIITIRKTIRTKYPEIAKSSAH
jgi:hypothetical protein